MPLSVSLVGGLHSKTAETPPKGQKTQSWYRFLLREAFRLSWRRKSLWFFGLFASLLATGSEVWSLIGLFSRVTQVGAFSFEWGDTILESAQHIKELLRAVPSMNPFNPVMLVGAVMFLVMLAIAILAVLCQGSLFSALVDNVGRPSDFRRNWNSGKKLFWKVALVNVIAKFGSALALLVIGLPLLSSVQSLEVTWIHTLLSIVAFLLFVPVILLFSLASKFILVHVTTHRSSPLHESFSESLHLLQSHWLVVVEFVIIMFFVSLLALLVTRVLGAILMLPFLFGMTMSYLFEIPVGVGVFYVGWLLSTLALVFVAAAYISTVEYTAWVLLYQKISSESVLAKLERLSQVIRGWIKR